MHVSKDIPIYETEDFYVYAPAQPFIDRAEGGHILIYPKTEVSDRTMLSPTLAIKYQKLTMIVGEALKSAMARRDVDIGIVNYQDMGNWMVFKPGGPIMHMHVYGRAKTAKIQKYGDAVQLPHRETGFYDAFKPLDEEDIIEISKDIQHISESAKYSKPWSE